MSGLECMGAWSGAWESSLESMGAWSGEHVSGCMVSSTLVMWMFWGFIFCFNIFCFRVCMYIYKRCCMYMRCGKCVCVCIRVLCSYLCLQLCAYVCPISRDAGLRPGIERRKNAPPR